jgi:hypothetical protein
MSDRLSEFIHRDDVQRSLGSHGKILQIILTEQMESVASQERGNISSILTLIGNPISNLATGTFSLFLVCLPCIGSPSLKYLSLLLTTDTKVMANQMAIIESKLFQAITFPGLLCD